ncbi:YcaO-like family protein [Sphaerisporangium dianthi]|uniref:YcaO-like family protein n=1 Tax=Sphaerisporangium dianthi TaxID=1436120 RepID=A0ABV9CQ35_9ACTN
MSTAPMAGSPPSTLEAALRRLDPLVDARGALVNLVTRIPMTTGRQRFPVFTAAMGNPGWILPGTSGAPQLMAWAALDGAGSGLAEDNARLTATVEAIERYSSCLWDPEQFIWASARSLGDEALDLNRVPRCSESELADPACPLVAPDLDAPMRWVRGVDLASGEPRWLPAVMVYLHIPVVSRGERFWLPISTGTAAHFDYDSALLGAVLECVERDGIALTWLQRLALPKIEIDVSDPVLDEALEVSSRSGLQTHFFDGTTDLGIPTVYSVDIDPRAMKVRTYVMCATELDPRRAVAKVMRESTSGRVAMQYRQAEEKPLDDYIDVFDGAIHMAAAERAHAFGFLLDSSHRRRLSDMIPALPDSAAGRLSWVVRKLQDAGCTVYAVDITSDEARATGLRVVRVIVPELVPLSFAYRARFLGTARLYEAPRRMGLPVHAEPDLNPWPQPFA